ncbi:MAG TPA: cysteine dioxygenase [Burkholderiaceae bacterium]|nr:cysteine dioxygenase [Burkholderiaceae bacterium]
MSVLPAELRPASGRLATFVDDLDRLLRDETSEPRIREQGTRLLAELIAQDDWLEPRHAVSDAASYQQFPLHVDAAGRFSVVAFVWGPGQATPIHDHTVWGLIGVLRGAEISQGYRYTGPDRMVEDGPPHRLDRGDVAEVSPMIGDVHRVRNAYADRTSISIHVYGGDIGTLARSIYGEDGSRKPFVSGYSASRR